MAEGRDRAVEEASGNPARIGQDGGHLVDDLLTLVCKGGLQTGEDGLDLVRRQADLLAAPLVRVGGVGRMPVAVDDADGDLALAFGEGVLARVEVGAERPDGLGQLGVMDPDLGWTGERAPGFDQGAVALLLLGGHLLVGDLDVAAKGWRVGHDDFLPGASLRVVCDRRAVLSTAGAWPRRPARPGLVPGGSETSRGDA